MHYVNNSSAMTIARETAKGIASLPPRKAEAVLDFARYLAERADDEACNESFARAAHSPKFKALLAEVEREIAEGKSEPLDPRKL